MRIGTGLVALLTAAILAGCASRKVHVAAADPLAGAHALVRQGCYDCLLDARAQYERALSSSPAAVSRLFEVELLLTLREKELAIDPAGSLSRAAALAPRLTKGSAEPILAAVRAVPESAGRRMLPVTADAKANLDATLTLIDSSPFDAVFKSYVKLSLECGRVAALSPADPSAAGAPLLTYRAAICQDPIRVEPLQSVRKEVPQFPEAAFFLGRASMGSLFRTDGVHARELFEEAYMRFQNSPDIAFGLATVYQATNDCRRADELFTRTLELRPAHEEARLNRAVCRTYLARHEEAIADTTILIDSGASASTRGDAYYWRAWNQRHLTRLAPARADIDVGRTLRYNARVLTLAGKIEYDQRDLDKARQDLEQATALDPRECDAPWYLGLVEIEVEHWSASATGFTRAAECYASLVRESHRLRAEMAARTDVSEEFKARQLAGFDAAIADDSSQRSASELNAAINFGRAGDLARATVYMKLAAVDPQRQSAVEDLRQVLGVPRW